MTFTDTGHAKRLAKLLREDLASAGFEITHSLALELIAHQFGARDWNVFAGTVGPSRTPVAPAISPGVPVLRVMSVAQALALNWRGPSPRRRRPPALASRKTDHKKA